MPIHPVSLLFRQKSLSLVVAIFFLLFLGTQASYAYEMEYRVKILPNKHIAEVSLRIPDASELKKLSFKNKPGLYKRVDANGNLAREGDRYLWEPPAKKAWISLQVNLLHERKRGAFDSFINEDWAIFRGDDLFPPVKVTAKKGAKSKARLVFELPENWPHVNTAWPRNTLVGQGEKGESQLPEFNIDNPARRFDRPTGWMIAGDIATRRELLGNTLVSISGPKREHALNKGGAGLKRMEALSLLTFVWPELQKLFDAPPEKLLIVGAGAPMWRGGLSGPHSLFMHADRPLVSENATSTLLHEVFHAMTRIRGGKKDDWIAEGLAEFYSVELLYRSGGMTDARYQKVFSWFEKRAQKQKKVRSTKSRGAVTARAVLIFRDLDNELMAVKKVRLDSLVRLLPREKSVDLNTLKQVYKTLTGRNSEVLAAVQ